MTGPVIMDELRAATRDHEEWAALAPVLDDRAVGVHLAVMLEPFLSYILNGQKTIESRFSKNAIAPYRQVAEGDLVFLKAGPVVGSFRVPSVTFVTLGEGDLFRLRREYSRAICAEDDAFWQARAGKRYATLVGIADVRKIPPVPVSKRDMRGWAVIRPSARRSPDERPGLW
jgi:hypothetical protein